MADAPAAETPPGALVEGYEALRAAVVGGRAEGWRHGYGVLAAGGWWLGWPRGPPCPRRRPQGRQHFY